MAGRGAVVVGGSRGIGLAVAELLAAQGLGVVVNGRDADAATEAAQRIPGAVGYTGSPAEPAVADALIDACITEFGRIDILVNCAGTAGLAGESILNVTSAQFRDLLDSHLGTTFETCRAAAPKMVDQGCGSIINTSREAKVLVSFENVSRDCKQTTFESISVIRSARESVPWSATSGTSRCQGSVRAPSCITASGGFTHF